MVARPGTERTNFNAGELAEELHARTDVKQWYAGAKRMERIEPIPQGGWDLIGGSRQQGFVGREVFTRTSLAGGSVTTSASGLLATFDLGASMDVAGIDIAGFSASAALDGALAFEISASAGIAGPRLAPALNVRPAARTRRLCYAPGAAVNGRYLRVILVATPAASTSFTLGTITVLGESLTSRCRLRNFGVTRDSGYVAAIAAGHVDFFEAGVHVGAAAIPYTTTELRGLSVTQRFDTMLLWHPDRAPHRILRVAGDHDWSSDTAPFTNPPLVDLGGSYSNGVAEVWELYVTSSVALDGNKFIVNIDGDDTNAVTFAAGGNWAATAANLQAAINALAGIGSGVTVTGGPTFTITFGGVNLGQPFSVTGRVISTTSAAITAGRVTTGVRAGEAIMSAARGWPRCGAFYQDRLFIAGFKAQPNAYAASAPGEYFDLNTLIAAASGPILDRLDTDGEETILAFGKSKQLVAFTNLGNRYLSNRTVSRAEPRNWVSSTNDGIAEASPIIDSEASLIFANAQRTALMAATYDDSQLGYSVDGISLMASHLIEGVRDMALQRPQSETDSQRLWVVRDDGLLVVGLLIRNQDVKAFVRWPTDGLVRSVAVDAFNTVSIAVERKIGTATRLVFETIETGLWLDQAITRTFALAQTVVDGLAALEGARVHAIADGYVEGPFTVTGASITLAVAASSVTVGRWTPPRYEGLPLSTLIGGQDVVLKRPKRVHTVRVTLGAVGSIAIGANDQAADDQPLWRFGDAVDAPIGAKSGALEVSGLEGWSETGTVTLTQQRPGAFKVLAVTTEAKT